MATQSQDPYRGIDMSQFRVDVIQQMVFLEYLWAYLKPHLEKSETEPFSMLEVGCGSGVFAKLLLNRVEEHRLPRSLQYTAIDPVPECVTRAKEMGVNAFASDFFSFVDEKDHQDYDLIVFTKSLHHVLPVDKAVALAASHLKEHGVLIADEFDFTILDEETARWFSESASLLEAAEVFQTNKRTHHTHVHQNPHTQSHSHSHSHSHVHEHEHQHVVDHHPKTDDPSDRFLHRFQSMFSKHDPALATWPQIHAAIKSNFQDIQVTDKIPGMFTLFAPRLVASEAGEKVMKNLMKMEEERIQDNHLVPVGVRVIASHRKTSN